MKCQILFSGTKQKTISKCRLLIVYFDCATGMCNYYFCKHLMKSAKVKAIILPVSPRTGL